jgi:RimJ/RimL family protein N-acetyltransferase
MLSGKLVRLRALEREDLPTWWAMNNDLEVELAGGGDPPYPQSLARLQAEYESSAGNGGRDGSSFAIEADGQMIGHCALFNVDAVARTAAVGISIGNKEYWGRGYGRDAIGVLVRYGFRYLNLTRIWLDVHGRNERAQRAYRSCGFVEEGRLRRHVWSDGGFDDLVYMGLLRDEWAASFGGE